MDPQFFVRLSVGQLGLKLPGANARKAARSFLCEIRLKGFPVQIAPVPLITSSEFNLDPHTNAAVFSLDESDLNALSAPGCFGAHGSHLEVAVYVVGRRGGHCGIVTGMRRLLGVVMVDVGAAEWRDGKPAMPHHGWVGVGRGEARPELHLRVKLEADPRYIFEFDDEVALNPQVVQLHGRIRQPIFSCKFVRDRRGSQVDQYWSSSGGEEKEAEMMRRRERKGWKVVIHDLSGSAVAAAFMVTPFVAANGRDTVARSNPGAWLIARAGATAPRSSSAVESWQPWGRLEAWRDQGGAAGSKDTVCLRLRLLPEGQDSCMLVAETPLRSDKGGEFAIDMDRQAPAPAATGGAEYCAASLGEACVGGGFVMSCRVEGEARSSRPLVQLAMRHVTCMEDAAMFVALAAAVDLSVKACRPFRRKTAAAKNKKTAATTSSPDPLDLDT
ncbi:uncharacterized protein LOC102704909 [Oryza brachyantha]|uniref:uncharacterized protein LOC102704909 n=1 Tax=Oryza brachyantha TaxID=4533 RepID=UPI001ADCA619|nr:uncharacterized protein LOC102704909 [Oryza brachyantha]XP_040382638.1 uncharacterized protein LOC102704909 [Oryza brachyantha]